MLETQNNLVKEVQEAMSAMNSIIKNTREEMMATANSSQLLMTENMRNLTKALETIKDNLLGRIASLDGNLGDLHKRMDLTNEAFNESSIRLTQTMETEFGRVDKVMDRFEDLMTESNKSLNDRINLNEERQQQWRSEYEDKNHNVFKEMSNTLKSLKKQILKVNKDSDDRDEELHRLVADAKKLTEGMIKNLDEKANHLESLYNFKLDESTKIWENNLQLEVVIRPDTLEVGDRIGGLIQSIPKVAAATGAVHDVKALSALMVQIKAKFPDKTDSTVLAEPDTPYDTLVQVMDAMRESHTVQGAKTTRAELFPNVSIGDAPVVKPK